MTGAAIATAGMGVVNGIGARKDAKSAQQASDREAAIANENMQKSAEMAEKGVGYSEEAFKYLEQGQAMAGESLDTLKHNQAMADNFANLMSSLGDQGIEYAQGLMDRWEDSFGGIQDNLTDYYNNLDPDKYATQNKAEFKSQMDKQMSQFNETMAASGLQSAGMKQQAAKEAAFKTAETNSQIDLAAEDQVADMKAGFLQFGEGQRQAGDSAMENALGNEAVYAGMGQNAQDAAGRNVAQGQDNLANWEAKLAQGQENIGNSWGNVGNAYQGLATQANQNAQNYGTSAAGYSNAAGNYFGDAMKSGITAYEEWNKD